MSDAIVVTRADGMDFTREQVELIKTQICKGASDAQLALFKATCDRLGLDPFARQIYGVMRKNRKTGDMDMTIQVSIDGFRSVADASGDYQGQTPAQWCGDDMVWREVWLDKSFPAAARIGVWREGFREPLYGVATWDSYMQGYDGKPSDMWAKMPDVMLAKCAEALALRKAFPRKLSGVYTPDEMGQADNEPATAMIGGSHVRVALPSEHTYDDPKQADEKGRVKAIAAGWCAERLPDLEERAAVAVAEMLECDPIEDAEIQAAERKAITAGHRAAMRAWCEEHGPRCVEVFTHPATSSSKSMWWNRMGRWAKAAGISSDEVKAMMAEVSHG